MLTIISLLTASKITAYLAVIDAVIALATTVAALTPTKADDEVVGRVANLWRKLRGQD